MKIAVALLIAVLLCTPAMAQETSRQPAAMNAAVKYLQAYAALRQSLPSPAGVFTPETALTTPVTPDIEKIVEDASEALTELHHGATLANCDWQISLEDGPLANTSHRGAVRELTAVSMLRARMRLRDKQTGAALDDLLSAMAMERHLSLDGTLASVLISYRLEDTIDSFLAQNLTQFSSEQLQSLPIRLDHLPSGTNLSHALITEKIYRNDFAPILKESHSREELIGLLLKGIPALKSDRALTAQIIDRCGGTVEGFANCVDQQRSFYQEMLGQFQKSPVEFQRVYLERLKALADANPVVEKFTPALDRFRWADAYQNTRRALFRSAIAVQLQGPTVVDRQRDPYDGNSFTFTPVKSGFRLDSHLKENDLPLSITVR